MQKERNVLPQEMVCHSNQPNPLRYQHLSYSQWDQQKYQNRPNRLSSLQLQSELIYPHLSRSSIVCSSHPDPNMPHGCIHLINLQQQPLLHRGIWGKFWFFQPREPPSLFELNYALMSLLARIYSAKHITAHQQVLINQFFMKIWTSYGSLLFSDTEQSWIHTGRGEARRCAWYHLVYVIHLWKRHY